MKFVVILCVALGVASGYYNEHEDDYHRYHGPKHYPIITKHGVPLDTPAVRDAKIHHHIAHEVASHQGHLYNDYHGDNYADQHRHGEYEQHGYRGPQHYPIITKQGVPLETPEVRDAKIHHHIAHEVAAHESHDYGYGRGFENEYQGSGYGHGSEYGRENGYGHEYGYHGPKHYPIITKQGVPLDTPAVRDAKIHHHIAHEVAAHQTKHYDGY